MWAVPDDSELISGEYWTLKASTKWEKNLPNSAYKVTHMRHLAHGKQFKYRRLAAADEIGSTMEPYPNAKDAQAAYVTKQMSVQTPSHVATVTNTLGIDLKNVPAHIAQDPHNANFDLTKRWVTIEDNERLPAGTSFNEWFIDKWANTHVSVNTIRWGTLISTGRRGAYSDEVGSALWPYPTTTEAKAEFVRRQTSISSTLSLVGSLLSMNGLPIGIITSVAPAYGAPVADPFVVAKPREEVHAKCGRTKDVDKECWFCNFF